MHSYNIVTFEEVTSTNEIALQAGKTDGLSDTVYVADRQTAGRGRRGRTWESSKTQNLYFSLLLCPKVSVDRVHMVTLVMAYALAKAIRELTGENSAQIKWPNDIVVNGKKVAGILTEMGFREDKSFFIVIGVGVNLETQDFEEELRDKATDIQTQYGCKIDKMTLLEKVLEFFEKECKIFVKQQDLSSLLSEYNGMLVNREKCVRVLDPKGEYQGVATGINEVGELLVQMSDGSMKNVYAGEVSVRGVYGYV